MDIKHDGGIFATMIFIAFFVYLGILWVLARLISLVSNDPGDIFIPAIVILVFLAKIVWVPFAKD